MSSRFVRLFSLLLLGALGVGIATIGGPADAAEAPVGLGTTDSFAVLAGSTVTNTNPSVISGDLGVSPGSAVTGFPPGIVINGSIHVADAVAAQAQADLTTAYNDAAGRATTANVPADLGGLTLVSGVYTGPTLGLTGTLTLDAQGDPNAVFIFQSASTLITASSSTVALINGASPCNVYWQIGSSATLGTNSVFVGTIMALTSITANTSATIQGRLLARNGAVTLDNNTITRPLCAPPTTTTTVPDTTTTVPNTTTTVPDTTTTTVPDTTTTVPDTTTSVPDTTTSVPDTTTSVPDTTTTVPDTTTTVPDTTTTVPDTTTTVPETTTTVVVAGQDTTTTVLTGAPVTARGGIGPGAVARTPATLPRTGAPLAATAIAGLTALLIGGVALLVAHRRSSRTLS